MDVTQNNIKIMVYTPPTSPVGLSVAIPFATVDNTISADTNSSNSSTQYLYHNSTPVINASSVTNVSLANTNNQKNIANQAIAAKRQKKILLSGVMLQSIREKLLKDGAFSELQTLAIEGSKIEQGTAINLVKERYLISAEPSQISAAAAAKTPASYRHLIDLTSSNLKCLDVYTGKDYHCKLINEPFYKVQRAYFQLQQDKDLCESIIYGHKLIRGVHDIVSLSSNRTYIIIEPLSETIDSSDVVMTTFENLHTYIRNKKRIGEVEARTIFHQICQTVQVCHRNGIILRDLKLKRFYFIDEARTKLQYESLEGSMILDDPEDDTLSDKIGCPLYTAPELLCPNPTYQGKPADMWSLGVILYTMLVGQYPFYEKANCNLITIIRHGNVQIPSSLSKSVKWLLLALLRKNYAERVTATHIFLTPWLKKQRPFFMYLPINIDFREDEDNDNGNNYNFSKKVEKLRDIELLTTDVSVSTESYGIVGQPLDYTRRTLQMQMSSSMQRSTDIQLNLDVDMG